MFSEFEIEQMKVEAEWNAPPYIDPMAVLTETARRIEEGHRPLVDYSVEEYNIEPPYHMTMDRDS